MANDSSSDVDPLSKWAKSFDTASFMYLIYLIFKIQGVPISLEQGFLAWNIYQIWRVTKWKFKLKRQSFSWNAKVSVETPNCFSWNQWGRYGFQIGGAGNNTQNFWGCSNCPLLIKISSTPSTPGNALSDWNNLAFQLKL